MVFSTRPCSLPFYVSEIFHFMFLSVSTVFFSVFFFTALFSCCKNKEKFTEPYVQIFANPFARLAALFRSSCSSPPTFYSLVSSTSVLSRRSFSVINDGVSRTSFFLCIMEPVASAGAPSQLFSKVTGFLLHIFTGVVSLVCIL